MVTDMDKRLDDALNTCIAAMRGTKMATILTDDIGGGIERLRSYLDEAARDRDRAVELLHMLDRHEARHPDVAEFLDELEERRAQKEEA